MFDESKDKPISLADKAAQGNRLPSANPALPVHEAEDMLADVDPTESQQENISRPSVVPDITSGSSATPSMGPSSPSPATDIPAEYLEENSGWSKKIIIITVVVIVAVLVVSGAVYLYLKNSNSGKTTDVTVSADSEVTDAELPAEVVEPAEAPLEPVRSFDEDSDADGLSTDQELAAGTDINNPDTDGDGLFDGEEIRAFGTNPLSKDTDGDGYTDGDEVRNGYNPKGPGRLFNVPK